MIFQHHRHDLFKIRIYWLLVHVYLGLDYKIEVVCDWTLPYHSFFLFWNLLFRILHYFLILDSIFGWFWFFCWFFILLYRFLRFWFLFFFRFVFRVIIIFRHRLLTLLVKVIEIFFCVQISKSYFWRCSLFLGSRVLNLTFWNIVHIININSGTYLEFIKKNVCFLSVFKAIPLVNLHKHKCLKYHISI